MKAGLRVLIESSLQSKSRIETLRINDVRRMMVAVNADQRQHQQQHAYMPAIRQNQDEFTAPVQSEKNQWDCQEAPRTFGAK